MEIILLLDFYLVTCRDQEKKSVQTWVFRAKLDNHFHGSGHLVQLKLDTYSTANWTLIPLQTGQFEAA